MSTLESVIVAFDGPSKCGKTTFVDGVVQEAEYQASIVPELLDGGFGFGDVLTDPEAVGKLEALQANLSFAGIRAYSAGNVFRAAAHVVIEEERRGKNRSSFSPDDAVTVGRAFEDPGLTDFLQDDDEVGQRVSTVARMSGVQALCNTVFCTAVWNSYNESEDGSLTVIDARSPVVLLQRAGRVGHEPGQILPASILPTYIHNPPEAAASRMKGDYAKNLEVVTRRRTQDEGPPLNYRPPADLVTSFPDWAKQYHELIYDPESKDILPVHLRFDNDLSTDLTHIQRFCGLSAQLAMNVAACLYDANRQPVKV